MMQPEAVDIFPLSLLQPGGAWLSYMRRRGRIVLLSRFIVFMVRTVVVAFMLAPVAVADAAGSPAFELPPAVLPAI